MDDTPVSTIGGRIEYLDCAKGFAILLILFFHYCQPYAHGIWSKVVMFGGSGVHLFFLLSGFGLGISSQQVNMIIFFTRRMIKIIIPYYVVIILIFACNLLIPLYPNDGIYALGGHLLLYKMFDEHIIGSFGYHFWYLSTLVQLYIAFPLIIRIKKRISSPITFAFHSLLISVVYWIFVTYVGLDSKRIFNSFFLQYLWEFNLGIVLADFYLFKKKGTASVANPNFIIVSIVAILSIATMGTMAVILGRVGQTFNDIPALAGIFSLSVLAYSMIRKTVILRNFFRYIGYISYELYLIHMFVLLLTKYISTKLFEINGGILISLFFVFPISVMLASQFKMFNSKVIQLFADRHLKRATS